MLNDIQKSILQTVSDMVSIPDGAVNIRLDGQKEFRQNSEHIQHRLQDRQGRHRHPHRRPAPRARPSTSRWS